MRFELISVLGVDWCNSSEQVQVSTEEKVEDSETWFILMLVNVLFFFACVHYITKAARQRLNHEAMGAKGS